MKYEAIGWSQIWWCREHTNVLFESSFTTENVDALKTKSTVELGYMCPSMIQ